MEGYHIKAKDGEVGHVEEFIIDDNSWLIRYLVVDTMNWLPAKKILIAPEWVENISWTKNQLELDLPKDMIENAPEYEFTTTVSREFEERLYEHYDKEKYWNM